MTNWYRVVVSFEVESDDEDEATKEANMICPDGIVESVTFVGEIDASTIRTGPSG